MPIGDVDYKIMDKDNKHIAYAIMGYSTNRMSMAFPISIPTKKMVKLMDKRISGVIIWTCDDGIIYGKINELIGTIHWYNNELQCSFDKQKALKYIRY